MNNYTVYGLTISSEIECPGLLKSSCQPDVSITLGSLDHILLPGEHRWMHFAQGENEILLNIKGVAKFLVRQGRKIVVDPYPDADENILRLFLLGSGFGAILHQRGIFPIHGNGIMHKGKCVIFAGPSGIGKSTLAAALSQKGYEVLSDDVCSVQVSGEGLPLVYPGFPQVKLWVDAAKTMNVEWKGLKQALPIEDKYILPIRENYQKDPAPLKRVFILGVHDKADFFFEDLDYLDAVHELRRNTYRLGMAKKMMKLEENLRMCSQVAKQVEVTSLLRPDDLSLMKELINAVEEQLR